MTKFYLTVRLGSRNYHLNRQDLASIRFKVTTVRPPQPAFRRAKEEETTDCDEGLQFEPMQFFLYEEVQIGEAEGKGKEGQDGGVEKEMCGDEEV